RTFTDWLLADPLSRWDLFEQAIAKDRAGVDAAFDRARAVGYRASRFTDALKALVGVSTANAAIASTTTTEFGGSDARPSDGGVLAKGPLPRPTGPTPSLVPPLGNWPSVKSPEGWGSAAWPPESADRDSRQIVVSARFAHDPGASDREGQVLSDASPDPGFVSGQRYAQLVHRENRAITGDKDVDRTTEDLLVVLEATVKEIGPGWGPLFGIRAHYAFAEKIRALNLPGIGEKGVEASFDFGHAVRYGLKNSVRVDIVLKDKFGEPIAVYDLKTGNAKLRPARVRELAEAAGVSIDRVIELRYNQLTAEQRW
ncbi:MAG TPA: hypothetical protein VJQ55_01345, partial [Candidatus Binatia bacterium]|nr:hypothetical protein [Candidatus Binatia bacterium]